MQDQGAATASINGFTIAGSCIWWSWNRAEDHYFDIVKDRTTGYYVFTMNQSLEDVPYGKWNLADWNKDIVKTLLSFVSSEPEEVFDAIYECLYEDAYVISTTEYTKVGDCQIRMDPVYSFREDGYCTVKFYIRPQ